jgi:hypothetical protein
MGSGSTVTTLKCESLQHRTIASWSQGFHNGGFPCATTPLFLLHITANVDDLVKTECSDIILLISTEVTRHQGCVSK